MPLLLGRAAVDDVTSQIAAWSRRARSVRLARLAATRDELATMVRGVGASTLSRRPAPKAWAAVEIVCHLRDLEESFHERIALIVVADEPRFPTTHPDRWALERQYLRHDADAAAAAFVAWRVETLALFDRLASEEWEIPGGLAGPPHDRRFPHRDGVARREPPGPARAGAGGSALGRPHRADTNMIFDPNVGTNARRLLARNAQRRLASGLVRYLTGDLHDCFATAQMSGRGE